jgi:hypothetical protein
MKHALVDGQRREAEPGVRGTCLRCSSIVISKCGERRIWHWAHLGERHCDHWWEPETEWHRAWKNKFPADWQEILHWADNREKHIADVKTAQGLIIEFQNSYINPDERRSREAFYKPMLWIVNGLRRKRDKQSFDKASGHIVRLAPLTLRTTTKQCPLLREWIDSPVQVFFDFGVTQEDIASFGAPVLWRLDPKSADEVALVSPVPLEKFIGALRNGSPIQGISRTMPRSRAIPPPTQFVRYMDRKNWRQRSRF